MHNQAGEDLGEIHALMSISNGRTRVCGPFIRRVSGLETNSLRSVEALTLSAGGDFFILNVARERLEQGEGFDKDRWPDMADTAWGERLHTYYGYKPYW